MKKTILLFAILGCLSSAHAQIKLTLDGNTVVKDSFWNAHPGSTWTGSQATGVFLVGAAQESFNGMEATVTIEGYGTMHGLIVHTAGNEGMAVICISDTGASALKCLQNTLFDMPANLIWRTGTTLSTDSAAREVHVPSGSADLDRWFGDGAGQTPSSSVDHFGAMHPPHVADTMALADSTYFSTTQSKLCYKDSSGAVHPLY